jgi:predicted secreted protein
MLKGKNLMISIGGVIYGYATDCSLNVNTDTSEVTTTKYKHKTSNGKWKEYDTDVNSWSGDSSYVMTESQEDYLALLNAQIAGTAVAIEFEPVKEATTEGKDAGSTGTLSAETAGVKMSGTGIITAIEASAPVDGEATYKVSLQGTGTLAIAQIAGA